MEEKTNKIIGLVGNDRKKNTQFFIIVKLGDKELFGHPKIVP